MPFRANREKMFALWPSRRRHPRVVPSARNPVEVHLMGGDFLEVLYAADISVGGLAVLVPHEFEGYELGVMIEVLIKLPSRRAFVVHGVIRHRSAERKTFGVEFAKISAQAHAEIANYVTARLQRIALTGT